MFSRVFYLEVKELGRQRLEKDHSGFQLCPWVWVTLGCPFSPPGLSVPAGGELGENQKRQGPGGSRTAHCGGPRPPEPARAARRAPPPGRGSWRRQLVASQLQPQHLPPPDGAGAAGPASPPPPPPPAAAAAREAEPEPSPSRAAARARPATVAAAGRGAPATAPAGSACARAAPPLQVRARPPRRCKVLGRS